MFGWLKRAFRRRSADSPPAIEADETGFTVTRDGHSAAYPWTCVTRIAAWKEDLFTTDEIRLIVETDKQPAQHVLLSEECPGFTTLFGPMEKELGINPSWYLEIMTPAFEPKPTVLYLRTITDGEPPLRSN